MVEPIRVDRHARVRHPAWPKPTAEVGRRCHLVFRQCDGVTSADVTGRALATWLCSQYFLEINTTIASVVLGVTSFGVLFFLFIVVAGTVSVSCPYQTPGARILRSIPSTLRNILRTLRNILRILRHIPDIPRHISRILSVFYSSFPAPAELSMCCQFLIEIWNDLKATHCSPVDVFTSPLWVLLLPVFLSIDAYRLGLAIIRLLVASIRWVLKEKTKQQPAVSDLNCILWTLRTSLEGSVRLSVLNYLSKMTLADFDPTLVVGCFDILIGCVKAAGRNMVIAQGSEELAKVSTLCCLHTISCLKVLDPTSRVPEDVHLQYTRAFPFETDFNDLPFPHTLGAIHCIMYPMTMDTQIYFLFRRRYHSDRFRPRLQWKDYKPSKNEHITVAHSLTKFAWSENRKREGAKVPRWLLRFALHFLSQDPSPPTSVVTSCLLIIAIDLGCSVPETTIFDSRCVHV